MPVGTWMMPALAFGLCLPTSTMIWEISDHGAWPEQWPDELEPLRKQARTLRGGLADLSIHSIPFRDREQFEEVWPALLKVKTAGAPILLRRSPHTHWHLGTTKAAVLIHCPPGSDMPDVPAGPVGESDILKERWVFTTWIELIVDGDVVDLNRIFLPAETPIVDDRFEEGRPFVTPRPVPTRR